jgi:hypothetical protein
VPWQVVMVVMSSTSIMLAGLKLDGTPRSLNLAELDLHGMGQDHIYNILKYALIPNLQTIDQLDKFLEQFSLTIDTDQTYFI